MMTRAACDKEVDGCMAHYERLLAAMTAERDRYRAALENSRIGLMNVIEGDPTVFESTGESLLDIADYIENVLSPTPPTGE